MGVSQENQSSYFLLNVMIIEVLSDFEFDSRRPFYKNLNDCFVPKVGIQIKFLSN
jgi:hypothetical protein